MEKTYNLGAAIGIMGGALGSVIWLFITGLAIQSWFFMTVPLLCGLAGGFFALLLLSRKPEQRQIIAGSVILLLVAINLVFGNLLFDRIPLTVWGMSTGKEGFSRLHLNLLLVAMSLFGIYLMSQGWRKKPESELPDTTV